MFSAAEFFDLGHTAHSKLFEPDKYVWEALRQIPSYLSFAQAGGAGGAGRKTVHQRIHFHRPGHDRGTGCDF